MVEQNTQKPKGLIHVVVFLILFITAIGIIVPTQPQLITQLMKNDVTLASTRFGALVSLSSFLQFILSPIFGTLSDKIGRKKTVLIQSSLICVFIGLLYISSIQKDFLIAVIAQIFNGLSGNAIQTCMASIADLSSPETRAQNFGLVGVAFGIGFVVGPLIGAMLGSLTLAFSVGTVLSLLAFFYALVFMRETLLMSDKTTSLLSSANPLRSVGILFQNKFTTQISIILILINLANQGFFSGAVHYNTYRYGFNSRQNGTYMMLVGIGTAVMQGFVMRRVIPKLGDMKVLRLCYILFIIFFLVMGYTDSGFIANIMILLYTVAGISDPIQQGLMSKEVRKEDQGSLQGAMSSLMLICKVIASISMSAAFSYFTSKEAPIKIPGIGYYIGAILATIAMLMVYRLPEQNKIETEKKVK
jgi:DHA1 family tetracycline resistance protein-like MFS transporter